MMYLTLTMVESWNNVNEDRYLANIEPEMERLGYKINDYYTSTTTPCAGVIVQMMK